MREIEMFVSRGNKKLFAPYEILGRIRTHFVGRVVTLAAATAFSAILSVALLPLATRHLGASDYGTYGLLMSIVVLVGAAADGGAGLLVPAHYGPASASERARLFVSLCCICRHWRERRGTTFDHPMDLATQHFLRSEPIPLAAIALSAALMPMRAITNISVMIFSVTDRGPRHRRTSAQFNRWSHFSALLPPYSNLRWG